MNPLAGELEATDVERRKADLDAAAERARKKGDIRGEVTAIREWRALDEHQQRIQQATPEQHALTAHPAWPAFVRQLHDVIANCEACRAALVAHVGGDTRAG
jgi:hypothetical protein